MMPFILSFVRFFKFNFFFFSQESHIGGDKSETATAVRGIKESVNKINEEEKLRRCIVALSVQVSLFL